MEDDSLRIPHYTKVVYWVQNYGVPGVEDNRATHDFMVVETQELISALRTELIAMSKGSYHEHVLDDLVGVKRKMRYGSYEQWAKYMLLWMAEFKG